MTTEPPVYDFLFPTEGREPYMDVLMELDDVLDELWETANTWRPKVKMGGFKRFSVVPPEVYQIRGVWELPRYKDRDRASVYVNPEGVHARHHADIFVDCDCGEKRLTKMPQLPDIGKHRSGCTREMREDARRRLFDRRIQWITKAGNLWLTNEEVGRRMDVSPEHVYTIAEKAGIDWVELRKVGRRRTILTWQVLEQNYKHSEIGKAFGVPRSTVSNYLNGTGRNVEGVPRA